MVTYTVSVEKDYMGQCFSFTLANGRTVINRSQVNDVPEVYDVQTGNKELMLCSAGFRETAASLLG